MPASHPKSEGNTLTPIERFEKWFVVPINKLKELPEGDGAFIALMAVLPLYERYIIAKLKHANTETSDEKQRIAISNDLNLNNHQRSIFWAVFRVGLCHQAMPQSGKTKWMISSKFGELPEFSEENGTRYVKLDPWKFADRVLQKYQSEPHLISISESFPLASIFYFPDANSN